MPPASSDREVTARIVYWGAEGAGKSTSLRTIHSKLKADHRGDFQELPTRLDPTITFESFSIQLGSINGYATRLRVLAVPGGPGLSATRKQLLDRVDGVVLVLDCQADRLEANLEALDELRETLDAYGDSFNAIPLVVQYNKRDLGDPYAIEELHRRLQLKDTAVFETVATEGKGILQCLTTISKSVVRAIRDREPEPAAAAAPIVEPVVASEPAPVAEPAPQPAAALSTQPAAALSTQPAAALTSEPAAALTTQPAAALTSEPAPAVAPNIRARVLMEEAILAEGHQNMASGELEHTWPKVDRASKSGDGVRIGKDLKVVSVGSASSAGERGVRVPLVLGNAEGETVTLTLTIQLDPLIDEDDDA